MKTIFRHYIPWPPLSRFVGQFWYYQGYDLQAGKERCLPSGTIELVISLHASESQEGVISGARSTSFILERSQEDSLLGIHFKAGGAFPFLGIPACEIENQEINIEDLWPGEGSSLRARLMEAPFIGKRFYVLENWLLSKLKLPMVHHPAVQYALSRLRGSMRSKTSELADEVNLSQRRFIQIFKNQVGLAPKLFGRVMRFQKILKYVATQEDVDWADLSLDHRYFDQAHFIHDFKEFSGITPSGYLTKRTEHLNHVKI